MNCPYCESELIYDDFLYKGNHAAYEKGYLDSGFKKTGDIWYCKNRNGFENLEEAEKYKKDFDIDVPIEEIVCESYQFNGFFWTDLQNNLKEGYPS